MMGCLIPEKRIFPTTENRESDEYNITINCNKTLSADELCKVIEEIQMDKNTYNQNGIIYNVDYN